MPKGIDCKQWNNILLKIVETVKLSNSSKHKIKFSTENASKVYHKKPFHNNKIIYTNNSFIEHKY